MTHPNKIKGNRYEYELRDAARDCGIPAERAYASDGRALGHTEGVDIDIGGIRVQAKRRKKLLQGVKDDFLPGEGQDAVAFREDRGESYITMRYADWLEMVQWMQNNGWESYETFSPPADASATVSPSTTS